MNILKNFFSQWYKYLFWLLISVIFWGWIFTLLTDTSAGRKLVLCADLPELRERELSDALEQDLPESIRMVAAHSFGYYIFDTEELRTADVFIVGEKRAAEYIESFRPLDETGFSAGDRPLWTADGRAYGVLIYDAETGGGAAKAYLPYDHPQAEKQNYYLFFGAESVHREDGTPAWLAEQLFQLP